MAVRSSAAWLVGTLVVSGCGRIDFAPRGDGALGDGRVADGHTPVAPRFVQKVEKTDTGTFTPSVVVPNVAAGDLLIVTFDSSNPAAGVTSLTDNTADSFTLFEEPTDGTWRTFIAYAIAHAAPQTTISLVIDAGPPSMANVRVFEYTSTSTTAPVSTSDGIMGSTIAPVTLQLATDEPNELLFGFFTLFGDLGAAGNGFVTRSTFDGDIVEDAPAVAPGMHDVTAVPGSLSSSWALCALAIRGR